MFAGRAGVGAGPAPKAPKADKPAVEKAPAEKAPAEKPAKKQAAGKSAATADAEKPSAAKELPPESPAVTAVLETKPATPVECMRAARVLVDLGRPDLAKDLLKKVIDAKLEPQQLVDLSGQVGSAVFFDLAAQPALLPEARQLADAVAATLNARLGDPQRIAGLIRQLQDPSVEKRAEAMVELQETRGAAIGPLLAVLADPARAAEQTNVRIVLAEMGRPARERLLGILQGAKPKLMVQAILTLAEMNNPKAELSLLSPCLAPNSDAEVRAAAAAALKQLTGRVPAKAEAIGLLTDAAKDYFDRHQPVEGAGDDKVELWRWDEGKQQCVAKTYAAEDAARAMAVRWAHDASLLAPDDRDIRLLAAATMLEAAAYEKGLDRPLDEKDPAVAEAKKLGVKTLDGLLDYGIAHGHPAAATVAARLLGQMGKAEEVLYQGEKPAPLALALRHPDRRLRMAALEAIVRLRPSKPFAGAGYVPGALQFFAASRGTRHALVATPNADETRELAGMLAAAGYQCGTALNGRDLLRLAAQSPDYELALIDVSIDRPEIAMLLQQLRHDERSASLRVGLIARSGYLERAERLARQDPLALAFSRPHDDASLRWQLAQLATLAPREFVGFETRQRQAAQALDLWAEANRSSSQLYDLRRVQDARDHGTLQSEVSRQGGRRAGRRQLGRKPENAGRSGQPLYPAAGPANCGGPGIPSKHREARHLVDERRNPHAIRPLQ